MINRIKQNLKVQSNEQQLQLLEYWEDLLGFDDKSFWKVTFKNPDKIQDLGKLVKIIENMEEQIKFTNSYSLKIMCIQDINKQLII